MDRRERANQYRAKSNGKAGVFNIGDYVETIEGDEGEIIAENNSYYTVRLRSGGTVRMRELDLEKATP